MLSTTFLVLFVLKHVSATPRHCTLGLHRNELALVKYIKTFRVVTFVLDDRSCVCIAGLVRRFEVLFYNV
jgi:hypothetical protein